MPETTALHRIYDANDDLLYVGISNEVGRRLGNHIEMKDWWQQVARVTVDWHATRAEAEAAEEAAIKAEKPRHNVRHNIEKAAPQSAPLDKPVRVRRQRAPAKPPVALTEDDLEVLVEMRRRCASGEATRLRDTLRLSEVAEAIGVTRQAVANWEAGTAAPTGRPAVEYGLLLRELEQIAKESPGDRWARIVAYVAEEAA